MGWAKSVSSTLSMSEHESLTPYEVCSCNMSGTICHRARRKYMYSASMARSCLSPRLRGNTDGHRRHQHHNYGLLICNQ